MSRVGQVGWGFGGMPTVPPGWHVGESCLDGQRLFGRGPRRKLQVIWSEATEDDGRVWRHVSVSTASAPLPTWEELEWVKRYFIGADREAYQVHAPVAEHVNLNEVLHLWACMAGPTGRVLPDFTHGSGSI